MMCFSGDMGGYMGLLLGASCMTLIELLDLLIYSGARKCKSRNQVGSSTSSKAEITPQKELDAKENV